MCKSALEEIWQVHKKFEFENLKPEVTSSQYMYVGEKII